MRWFRLWGLGVWGFEFGFCVQGFRTQGHARAVVLGVEGSDDALQRSVCALQG